MPEILTVDARGLSCPQPVLEVKRVLVQNLADNFMILVDNITSRENVSRFARNQGCEVQVQDAGPNNFEIRISRINLPPSADKQETLLPCPTPEQSAAIKNVVFIGNKCMGKGDDQLGAILMRGFLRTLIDVEPRPWRIIFVNSGVELTTVDEEAAEAVVVLQDKGTEVLSCGTCLKFFGLEEKLKAGKVTNMFEIIETFNSATRIISPD